MTLFNRIFGQPSARVVALARVGLATVFFLGTWAEPQPDAAPIVMPALVGFLIFSAIIAAVTWNNWWVDARIALVTHAIDVCFFVIVVGSPQGYSSPYFLFFVFLLLSSAIRWTWRETAATAAVVVALYVVAGLLMGVTSHTPFELVVSSFGPATCSSSRPCSSGSGCGDGSRPGRCLEHPRQPKCNPVSRRSRPRCAARCT